jgi:hypothetical protein
MERAVAAARTPESIQKRLETRRRNAGIRREYVVDLWNYGMVVSAIADEVGYTDDTVKGILRQEGVLHSRSRYGLGVIHEDPKSPLWVSP